MTRQKATLWILGITAILGIVSLGAFLYVESQPILLRHVAASTCPLELPADATDVTYYDHGLFAPYRNVTFLTSKSAFEAWAKHCAIKPVIRTEGVVECNFSNIDGENGKRAHSDDGIKFEWIEEDRGQVFLFDRASRRAYYQINNR